MSKFTSRRSSTVSPDILLIPTVLVHVKVYFTPFRYRFSRYFINTDSLSACQSLLHAVPLPFLQIFYKYRQFECMSKLTSRRSATVSPDILLIPTVLVHVKVYFTRSSTVSPDILLIPTVLVHVKVYFTPFLYRFSRYFINTDSFSACQS